MRTRTLLLLALILVIAAAIGGYRMYTEKTPTAAERDADVTVEAKALYDAFKENETAANATYNGKVVQVKGTIRDVTTDTGGRMSVMLETGDPLGAVVCEFAPGERHTFTKNAPLTIKGFCAGFNLDVQLQRCAVVD